MTPQTHNGGYYDRATVGILMQLNLDRSGLIQALATNRPAQPQATQAIVLPESSVLAASRSPNDTETTGAAVDSLSSRLDAHLEYEANTRGHQGAIAQYLLTQHGAQREQIQQMVGIDLYA